MRIDNNSIENLFKVRFEDYSQKPSQKIWRTINKKLWLKDFTTPSFKKFNIYYSTAIAFVAGSYMFFQFSNIDKNNEITEISTTKTYSQEIIKENADVKELVKTDAEKSELKKNNKVLLPVSDFSASVYQGCVPLEVNFKNKSKNSSEYKWVISNGNTITKKDFSYIFTKPGKYTVDLISIGENGKNKTSKTINVVSNPVAKFDIDESKSQIQERLISVKNNSVNAAAYTWIFGDGTTSDENEPNHQYKYSGKYNIELIAESSNGCKDTIRIRTELLYEDCYLKFPEAFVPSVYKTRINNEMPIDFKPEYNGINDYNLEILAPNGQVVFSSNNPQEKWKGMHKNFPLPKGIYSWRSSGIFSNGEDFSYSGNVDLYIPRQEYDNY